MNLKNFFILAVSFFLIIFFQALSAPSFAEEPEQIYELGEVIVTGEGHGVEATGTVYEITAQEIEQSNARSLDEAIDLVPGIMLGTRGEGVPRLDIRGFRTRHVLLLVDGVPFNSTYDQMFDPSAIPVENIAKIKVSVGNSSLLYGQGGIGGAINIITKKGTHGVHADAVVERGSERMYLARGSISGASDKFYYFISGSTYKRRGFPLSDDFEESPIENGGLRENSDKKTDNFFANIGYSPTNELNIGLNFAFTENRYGIPGIAILDYLNLTDPFAESPKKDRVNNLRDYSVQLAGDYDVPGPLKFRSWVFFNKADEKRTSINLNPRSVTPAENHAVNRMKSWGAALQTQYDLEKAGLITLGLSFERDKAHANSTLLLGGGGDEGGGGLPGELTGGINLYTAVLEYEFSPLENLGFVLSYGRHWLNKDGKSFKSKYDFSFGRNIPPVKRDDNDNDYSMLAGVHYDMVSGTRLKASFSRKIRFPSVSQFFDSSKGNLGLTAERAYQYEVGVEQKLPLNSSASITGFLTDTKGFIEKDKVFTQRFENKEKYRFMGYELVAQSRPVESLILRGTYSYLNAENIAHPQPLGMHRIQYRPRDKFTLEGNYSSAIGLTPYVSLLYVANQHALTKANIIPVKKKKISDYTLVNVKLTQKVFGGKMAIYVGADNLFDKNYVESYGIPQAGRFVYGGIKVSI
ncbi:MAG: TonB-dependent receptor [Candidatus Schekmanbacteria bacterium]|nr:TonB-dependent receptor [Candidatus Schekmanbacteria bacterium]